MKKILKDIKVILLTVLIFAAGACTEDFEEMNTNPNSPVDVPAINIFTNTLVGHMGYEMGGWIQHTYLGCWSQQWTKVQYIDEDKYQIRDMTGDFEGRYTGNLLDLTIVINKATEEENNELLAAAKIWRALIFSFLTDGWGDIPYTEALQGLELEGTITPKYDTQESVYNALLAELEEANNLLTSSSLNFGSGDVIFGGDPMKWKKFGNSLRLRLLNRAAGTPWSFTYDMVGTGAFTTNAGPAAMSDADAKIAEILGNSTANPIMTSNDDNVMLAYPGLPYRNPIFNTLFSRTDQGIAQTIVDFLNDRNDPRVHIYAQPTPKSLEAGAPEYNGHQNGLAHAAAVFQNVSLLGTQIAYNENAPVYAMCLDEVEFIQAEYYMRKGDDGMAKQHYEAGIAASMERWGCVDGGTVTASTKDDGALSYTYDVSYADYLAHPLVAWGGNTGEKFQKIIEQKWAGMFGQGVQAWHEVRRTGFPARVFEYELEDDYTPDMGMPVRIHYSYLEQTYNGANLDEAKARQNIEDLYDGMYSTNGTSSQMWWHTRKNPIPTEIDPPPADKQ